MMPESRQWNDQRLELAAGKLLRVGVTLAAERGRQRGLIQLGLLLLIATPVARVVFSVYAFARERDWVYVGVTLIVLGVLLYSLLGGQH